MQRIAIIIDDDPEDIQFLTEAIAAVDGSVKCISFENPVQAIGFVTKDHSVSPAFIFLDFNMPQMTGEECLERLKEVKHLDATTFVVNSTSMPRNLKERLHDKGAAHAFKKEETARSLHRIVKAIFRAQNSH